MNIGTTIELGKSYLSVKFRKDNFIVNEANKEAFDRIFSEENDNPATNKPIFLIGEHGVGKTHLMQAYGNYLEERYPEASVLYLTGENFIREILSFIRSGKDWELRERYRTHDYLLIDDVDELLGKELSMREMVFTIKDTIIKDKMVVVSSHNDFTKDPNCEEEFRAVFCGWEKIEMHRA